MSSLRRKAYCLPPQDCPYDESMNDTTAHMPPTKDLKVALFPMPIKWSDKAANIDTLIDIMPRLHPQTDLLILPETFSTGFPSGCDRESVRVIAERNSGATMDTVRALADRYGVAICGSFVADTGGLLFNRAFFVEPGGEEYYADKRHLFTMAGEHNVFHAGRDRMNLRFRGWNISMIVCYDIRFPVWCRSSFDAPYDLLVAVANWPEQRVDAWRQLLRSRAIENEAYVCGVDCMGIDPQGNHYDGSSAVFDFKGKDAGVTMPDSQVIYATLEAAGLSRFREKFPAWRDADHFTINGL